MTCGYCSDGEKNTIASGKIKEDGYIITNRLFINRDEKLTSMILAQAMDGQPAEMRSIVGRINYCPMCGRKLV